jgi:hypothetical protein
MKLVARSFDTKAMVTRLEGDWRASWVAVLGMLLLIVASAGGVQAPF